MAAMATQNISLFINRIKMYTIKTIILFLILALCGNAFAQPPEGYYDKAKGLSGAKLKTALFNTIKNHKTLSYGSLWDHFETTDLKPDSKIWDMYSDNPTGRPPYVYDFGTNQCGTYKKEGDCYNREHSFPKSWFGGKKNPMHTDIFHIYPTDGYVNSRRSNYPYGEVDESKIIWESENGSKLGISTDSIYPQAVFEPIEDYKGDFARSYFYMATCYQDKIAGWKNNTEYTKAILDGTDSTVYQQWYLKILLQWHYNDPVSQKEINRNNSVFKIQKNRNPFIDSTHYVERIWDKWK